MSKSTFVQTFAIVLTLFAALICYKLLAKHVTGSSGSAWFEAACTDDDEGGGPNCAAVLASPHSYWPPKKTDEPEGIPHIPVAFLGLVYYSMLTVWLVGVGRPSRKRRWFHLIPLIVVLCGMAASIRYTFIIYTVLDEWCSWCLVTHILNLLIVICVVLMWPWAPRQTVAAASSDSSPAQDGIRTEHQLAPSPGVSARHPSWIRVLGTGAVIAIVLYGNYGQWGLLTVSKTRATLNRCVAAVNRIKGDVTKLVRNWELGDKHEIPIRPDDPALTKAKPDERTLDVIVFSDFVCPSCFRFARFFDEEVQPLFGGRLRVIFKHYPLDKECNGFVSRTVHRNACATAGIAEAARVQGGSEAFWKAHDLLFDRQLDRTRMNRYNPIEIANELGLDSNRLVEDMESADVAFRLLEDIELGHKIDLRGTPAVFIDGKPVDVLARMEVEFWDELAHRFWRNIGVRRPKSTWLKKKPATPDSPDRKAAP